MGTCTPDLRTCAPAPLRLCAYNYGFHDTPSWNTRPAVYRDR
jgi:hypothetical protein